MLERTVGVVYVSVQHVGTILLDMLELHWHGLQRPIEDTRIIDVIPCVEEMVCAFKLGELVDPEVLSVRIQKVHEGRVSGPGLSIQSLAFLITDEDVLGVAFFPLRVLQFEAISIDEVACADFDVRVNDGDQSALGRLHLFLESIQIFCSIVVGVEGEPLIVTSLRSFVLCPERMLDVHPEDINWKFGSCEVLAALCYHVG